MRYLKIPKRAKSKGEYVYCSKCKTNIDGTCKLSNKSISTCKFPHRHIFKTSYYVPGSGNKRIMEYFKTRDYKVFKDQARAWLNRMESLNITPQNLEVIKQLLKNEKEEKKTEELPKNLSPLSPHLVANSNSSLNQSIESKWEILSKGISFKKACQIFLDYMADFDVPIYNQKNYSDKYLEEISRNLTYFAVSLKEANKNPHTYPFRKIGPKEVEAFYIFLTESKDEHGNNRFGNHSYNKGMLIMKKLYEYFIKKKNYKIDNPFENVKKRKTIPQDISSMSLIEFKALINAITKENGWATKKDRNRTYRFSHYQPWLCFAFRLALETGERRDGLAYMTWENVDMENRVINVRNHKVSNMEKREIIRKIPITVSLMSLLDEMGYEANKDSMSYLIAPESKVRRTVIDKMSKAFTHYLQFVNTNKSLSFKNLRKTYATLMYKYFGNVAGTITGQNIDTIIKHYLDKETIMIQARKLSLIEIERSNYLTDRRAY